MVGESDRLSKPAVRQWAHFPRRTELTQSEVGRARLRGFYLGTGTSDLTLENRDLQQFPVGANRDVYGGGHHLKLLVVVEVDFDLDLNFSRLTVA